MARLFISGSGQFGAAAAQRLAANGHTIVGVASPTDGRRGGYDALTNWCMAAQVPRTDRDALKPADVPDRTDAILAAHSHAFIGRLTRARAPHALGYHPSLLPLHRGRDAVRWQARLGERVVGGSIYHLTDRIDGGPLADRRHVIVPPGLDASTLWSDYLFPLGIDMLADAAADVDAGRVDTVPQDDRLATWEPSFDSEPLYRPELLELPSWTTK